MVNPKDYFKAFNESDLNAIADMLHEDVSLQDPFVGLVKGKKEVLKIYENLFAGVSFDLELKREYGSEFAHAFEFKAKVTDSQGKTTIISGVDLLEIQEGRIHSLRAYLDTSETA